MIWPSRTERQGCRSETTERKESPLSTQTSATLTFRALVMATCAVALPLIALFGTSLPDTLKQILQRQFGVNVANFSLSSWTGSASGAGPAGPNALDMTAGAPLRAAEPGPGGLISPSGLSQPSSVQANIAPTAALAPGYVSTPTSLPVPPALAAPPTALAALPAAAPVASFTAQSSATPLTAATRVASAWPDRPALAESASAGVVPAGFQAQMDTARAGRATADAAALVPAGAAAAGSGDRFSVMQSRLKQLGATYTLLESWGSKGDLYRFYCKLAIGGNVNYTRYFEATDPDSFSAMAKVLQQVEAWRAGRL